MAECPGGRTGRGTRSQFRLRTPGPGGFLKGSYPIRLGDIMDVGQSSQTGLLSPSDLVSPNKGTRTRTVREYEQTISELKRENFDLKLRVFFVEESIKNSRKDKDSSSPDQDNTIEVMVQLQSETESLRKELSYKDKLLQDALYNAEKYESELKELKKKYAELQHELASLSQLPSKQEFMILCNEKERLLNENESLEKVLLEKNEEIDILNQKLDILANQNTVLEDKIKKRSIAIRGFVEKSQQEKKLLPDELRNVVISATRAAKNKNKEDLAIAVKSFNSVLFQIMSSPIKTLSKSEEKENIESSQAKCLKEEFLEKQSMLLPSQSESCTELSHMQVRKVS